MLPKILLVIIMFDIFNHVNASQPVVICSWQWWYKIFSIDDVSQLCTHILYTYVELDEENFTINEMKIDKSTIKLMLNMKKSNPSLKLILSIGGIGDSVKNYTHFFRSSKKRIDFLTNTVKFLKNNNFDGVNWVETGCYYTDCNKNTENVRNDVKDFRQIINESSTVFKSNKLQLIVTFDQKVSEAFHSILGEISDLVDYQIRWNTDTTEWVSGNANHAAPMKSVEKIIRTSLDLGAASGKLILHTFIGGFWCIIDEESLELPETHIRSKCSSISQSRWGNVKQSYICELTRNLSLNERCADLDRDAYIVFDKTLITYVNLNQIFKYANLVKEFKLGGIALHALQFEDYKGICFKGVKSPILKAVNIALETGKINVKNEQPLFEELISRGLLPREKPDGSNNQVIILIVSLIVVLIGSMAICFTIFRYKQKTNHSKAKFERNESEENLATDLRTAL